MTTTLQTFDFKLKTDAEIAASIGVIIEGPSQDAASEQGDCALTFSHFQHPKLGTFASLRDLEAAIAATKPQK